MVDFHEKQNSARLDFWTVLLPQQLLLPQRTLLDMRRAVAAGAMVCSKHNKLIHEIRRISFIFVEDYGKFKIV